jgi:7,8-dihydropterin-6-yl-methyl-4-(beta-D-ribofuranosyl)aminobenzene 5'-phosphate synthase
MTNLTKPVAAPPLPEVARPVRITVLVENTAAHRGLLAEHGLSFWIKAGANHILFDTGQTDVFVRNARALGIDLTQASAIVLSHGHYDHTGGLASALQLAPRATVFLHPDALKPRFSRHADGTHHDVGLPNLSEHDIRRRGAGLVLTERPTHVGGNVFVTGAIPRLNDFEDVGGDFFLDAQCVRPDPLADDQALYFRCAKGIVVVLGCAHAGVVNTLRYVQSLAGECPVHMVIGGMHLLHASERRLNETLQFFRQNQQMIVAPGHCTGFRQTMAIWSHLADRCRTLNVGSEFVLE